MTEIQGISAEMSARLEESVLAERDELERMIRATAREEAEAAVARLEARQANMLRSTKDGLYAWLADR